jgi:hypothetical protein
VTAHLKGRLADQLQAALEHRSLIRQVSCLGRLVRSRGRSAPRP